jgi:hypothetical protein
MKQSYQLEKNILLFYLIEVLKINQIIEVSLIQSSGRGNGYHKYDFMIYKLILKII